MQKRLNRSRCCLGCGPNEPCVRSGPGSPCGGSFEGVDVVCTAEGWLKEQDQQFFYSGIRALEKCRTKCVSLAGIYVESVKIWCTYLAINCVGPQTFGTPVVFCHVCLRYAGACEGTLACSTCHLIFSQEDFDKLPQKPTDEELDMLDLAYGLTDT